MFTRGMYSTQAEEPFTIVRMLLALWEIFAVHFQKLEQAHCLLCPLVNFPSCPDHQEWTDPPGRTERHMVKD